MRSFSPGAVATIALWKSAPMRVSPGTVNDSLRTDWGVYIGEWSAYNAAACGCGREAAVDDREGDADRLVCRSQSSDTAAGRPVPEHHQPAGRRQRATAATVGVRGLRAGRVGGPAARRRHWTDDRRRLLRAPVARQPLRRRPTYSARGTASPRRLVRPKSVSQSTINQSINESMNQSISCRLVVEVVSDWLALMLKSPPKSFPEV